MENFGINKKIALRRLIATLAEEGYVLTKEMLAVKKRVPKMQVRNGITHRIFKTKIEDSNGKKYLVVIPFDYQRYRRAQVQRVRGDEIPADFEHLPYARNKKRGKKNA